MKIEDSERQIIWGSLLGGASLIKPKLGKNYYLAFRSSNADWIEYKIQELKDFFWELKGTKQGNTYRCQTIALPYFTELRKVFFQENKRKIDIDILSLLTAEGIAVWFLDGGGKTGRGNQNAYLNTTLFGEQGTQIIQNFFNEIIEIPCQINKNKERRRIVFSLEGTLELFKIIAGEFPTFMEYRLD